MRRFSLALAVAVSHLAVNGTCFGDHLIWRGCGVSKTAFMEACASAYEPGAKAFVAWLLSDAGQAIVKAEGTVDLKDGAALTALYRHFADTRQIANYDQLLDLAKQAKLQSADESAP